MDQSLFDDIDTLELESEIRDEVRAKMTLHLSGDHKHFIEDVAGNVGRSIGYSLLDHTAWVDNLRASGVKYTLAQWDAIFALRGLDPLALKPTIHRSLVIPKFVAALTVGLRAKFGALPNTEANRLLIEREYLRVCREHCVRNIDIVAHSQYVYNCFFGETVLDHIATVRVRVPAWMRRAFGGSVPPARAVVC